MHNISWGSAASRRKTSFGTRIECFQGPSLKYIANLDLAPRSAVQRIGRICGRGNLQVFIAAREVIAASMADSTEMSLLFGQVQCPALPPLPHLQRAVSVEMSAIGSSNCECNPPGPDQY